MSGSFVDAGGELIAEKPAGARLAYTLQWDGLAAILSSAWAVPSGLVIGGQSHTASTSTVILQGGTPGAWHYVTNTVTTSDGQMAQKTFRVFIPMGAAVGAGIRSVFGDLAAAVAGLRRDRLAAMLENYAPGRTITDEYLLEKLVAAEKAMERELRIFFTPREMIPPGTPQAEIEALEAAGETVMEEPGYDYDPDMFRGNTWGLIELRQRPIIQVHRVWFAYPDPVSSIYAVPIEWVRPEKKIGRINLVPSQAAALLPLNAFILSAVGGGRKIPLMLQVRYRAGLVNAAADYPDLLTLIKRQAVLDMIGDIFVPGSGSVSADGLSQTISFEAAKYQDEITAKVAKLQSALHGIRVMVM